MIFDFEADDASAPDARWAAPTPWADCSLYRAAAHTAAAPHPQPILASPAPEASCSHHPHATPSPARGRGAPPPAWRAAAQDSLDGVHYTREAFPGDGLAFLAPPFAREPLAVGADERVVLLDEVSEFALRVRVLRTGAVGLLPAWNVEGALERLARVNMLANEVATCPKEIPGARTRAHVHDDCISSPRLRIAFSDTELPHSSSSSPSPSPSHSRSPSPSCSRSVSPAFSASASSDADIDDLLATPLTPPDAPALMPFSTARKQPSMHKRGKSVEFARSPRRTVFRYPQLRAAPDIGSGSESDDDNDSDGYDSDNDTGATAASSASSGRRRMQFKAQDGEGEGKEGKEGGDAQWWWDGWEESQDVPVGPPESDSEDEEDEGRVGRGRARRFARANARWGQARAI